MKRRTYLAPDSRADSDIVEPSRMPYERPRLTDFGDLRDRTLGGSPGPNDSSPANTKIPAG